MRIAVDTSALVAALCAAHEHHSRAQAWLDAIRDGRVRASVAPHALAELFATFTRLPPPLRLAPTQARDVVDKIAAWTHVVDPTVEQYRRAMDRCVERGVGSGAVYDALHVIAAEEADADAIVTFNETHFLRLSRPGGPQVVVPPDPPRVALD